MHSGGRGGFINVKNKLQNVINADKQEMSHSITSLSQQLVRLEKHPIITLSGSVKSDSVGAL